MSLHGQARTLHINNIPVEKLQALIERAKAFGTTPEEYALHLIAEGLEPSEKSRSENLMTPRRKVEKIKEGAVTPRVVSEWYGRLEDAEPFPDLGYWLSQDDAAKFDAAWEMVIEAHQIKGEDIRESRLQRSVGGLQRREG